MSQENETPEQPRMSAQWAAMFPAASAELNRLGMDRSPEAMAAWRQRYPEAAEAWGRMVLSSPDVVRKMRMTDPEWEPPG